MIGAFLGGLVLGAVLGAVGWAKFGAQATAEEQAIATDAKSAASNVESIAKGK